MDNFAKTITPEYTARQQAPSVLATDYIRIAVNKTDGFERNKIRNIMCPARRKRKNRANRAYTTSGKIVSTAILSECARCCMCLMAQHACTANGRIQFDLCGEICYNTVDEISRRDL